MVIKSKVKPKQSKSLKTRVEDFLNSNLSVIKKIPPVDIRNLFEDLQIYQADLERHYEQMQKVHQQLQKSERRFRNFLDNLGDAAYEMDASGRITYANKMGGKITGLPLKDIIGKSAIPLFAKDSQALALQVYQRTLSGENPECHLTLVSGRTFHFKTEPLRGRNNKIIGVFGIARDITERKKLEENLNQMAKERTVELEEKNTALKVLLNQREGDKRKIEETIMDNVKELLTPNLTRLKNSKLSGKQQVMLNTLESNFNEIFVYPHPFQNFYTNVYV